MRPAQCCMCDKYVRVFRCFFFSISLNLNLLFSFQKSWHAHEKFDVPCMQTNSKVKWNKSAKSCTQYFELNTQNIYSTVYFSQSILNCKEKRQGTVVLKNKSTKQDWKNVTIYSNQILSKTFIIAVTTTWFSKYSATRLETQSLWNTRCIKCLNPPVPSSFIRCVYFAYRTKPA